MKWHCLDPQSHDPKAFGLDNLYAVKAAKWHGKSDIRGFRLRGWELIADLTDRHPVTGKQLKQSAWWVWAAKGR